MEDEEDDDIYAPEDFVKNGTPLQVRLPKGSLKGEKGEDSEEGEEEGEEIEEEGSDSVHST